MEYFFRVKFKADGLEMNFKFEVKVTVFQYKSNSKINYEFEMVQKC